MFRKRKYRVLTMRVTTPSVPDTPPTAKYLENDLGYEPVWTYQELGRYTATLVNVDYRKVSIPNRFIHDLAEQRISLLLQVNDASPDTVILLQLCDISDIDVAVEFDGETTSDFELRIYDDFQP